MEDQVKGTQIRFTVEMLEVVDTLRRAMEAKTGFQVSRVAVLKRMLKDASKKVMK